MRDALVIFGIAALVAVAFIVAWLVAVLRDGRRLRGDAAQHDGHLAGDAPADCRGGRGEPHILARRLRARWRRRQHQDDADRDGRRAGSGAVTLKSCPFCGGAELECLKTPSFGFRVGCEGFNKACYATGPYRRTKQAAIAAWNRRTPDWERRYGELVETVVKRTDQAKGAK